MQTLTLDELSATLKEERNKRTAYYLHTPHGKHRITYAGGGLAIDFCARPWLVYWDYLLDVHIWACEALGENPCICELEDARTGKVFAYDMLEDELLEDMAVF